MLFSHDDDLFTVRDIIDSQLETSDDVEIGRVADIEIAWYGEDGQAKPVLTNLVTGPQALAKRIAPPLHSVFRFLLRDRFEHCISLQEVEDFGPTLRLHGKAKDYETGKAEGWIAAHILRWIPGSGY